MPGEASGDLVGSRRPPRAPRAPRVPRVPLYAGRRLGRLAFATAAVLVVGLGLSARYVLSRTDTDHHGGVLTMVGTEMAYEDGVPVTDVTLHWAQEFSRLAAVTNDGLVGFRRAGGLQGGGIVPDLATGLPEPTDNGLTYTFHLRKGVRYSTGAPVLAGDIRRGIERTVAHPDTTPPYYTTAILGAQACTDAATKAVGAREPRPDCDLHAGITADDRTGTIIFHLRQPTPEFPNQLALPGASAVPQDTPLDLQPEAILPATGPYMIRSFTPGHVSGNPRLVLVRNPHFHVWSSAAQPQGYPDRIVLETGYTNDEVVERLSDGRADISWSGTPQADEDRLRTTHGSKLLLTTPGANETHYVFLNATKPPFNNRDARRAVAYALDRGALTGDRNSLSGPVTCQLIPPGYVAYHPYCPFTLGGGHRKWAGPDPITARQLVRRSGTSGAKVVLVVPDDDPGPPMAGKHVVAMLNRIGYRASLLEFSIDDFFGFTADPKTDWNAGVGGWGVDYPGASEFLVNLASCDPALRPTSPYNISQYCNSALDKQMAAAVAQQLTDPVRASKAWARIDRAVVDAAAIIPFGSTLRHDLIGPRVGNTLVHPFTGPLIAQMWVQ
jgi:peptide/nickel transport system substrate-binding protein